MNYIHYKTWDKITYPFANFNGTTAHASKMGSVNHSS